MLGYERRRGHTRGAGAEGEGERCLTSAEAPGGSEAEGCDTGSISKLIRSEGGENVR